MHATLLHAALFIASMVGVASAALEPERIALWPGTAPNGGGPASPAAPSLTVFRPDHPNGALMIICPGGGYAGLVTGPEGTGIATWLNQHGIIGAVLEYRLPRGNSALPLLDAQRAIRLVRSKAASWQGNPQRIGIIGFSAGGHLASTAGTHFDEGNPSAQDPVERLSSRPDFMVLIYPVITMSPLTHGGSKRNLLGPSPTEAVVDLFSNEKQVTDQTPPAFLAHAKDDQVVPPEHSRLFTEALKTHHIPVEYLELPSGGHGLNGYKGPSWEAWQTQFLKWLGAQKSLAPDARSVAPTRIIPAHDPQVLAGLSPLKRPPLGLPFSPVSADEPPPSDPIMLEKPPTQVDLRPRLEKWGLKPRPQGNRPTCSVVTFTGALEFAVANARHPGGRLSVEFLNWSANQTGRGTRDGGFFSEMWDGFASHGICTEKQMPYQPEFER